MAIYLVTYALYFAILGIGLARKNKRRWIIGATFPMFALVWLRGNVGVDLPMYVQSIELIQQNKSYTFIFEPGFEILILAIAQVVSSPPFIAKLIATITTALLLANKWKTRTAYQALGLGIIPYFYFDMTMNGLRYGLAFSIALFSLNGLLAIQRIRYASSMLIAASMQVSSFYLTGLMQFLSKPNWKYLLLLLPIVMVVALVGSEYFILKATVNAGLSKPGVTAGIAPLALSVILLIGCWSSKPMQIAYRNKLALLFAASIASYGVTQISYAGLRLQQLNYFLILLFLIYAAEKMRRENSKNILIALILVAALGSLFRLNNFLSEAGNGEAPFAPYKFFWSEQ